MCIPNYPIVWVCPVCWPPTNRKDSGWYHLYKSHNPDNSCPRCLTSKDACSCLKEVVQLTQLRHTALQPKLRYCAPWPRAPGSQKTGINWASIKEAPPLFFTYRVYSNKCPNRIRLCLFPAINLRILALVPKKMGKYIHLEKLEGGPK
jgi:hypothetical protein